MAADEPVTKPPGAQGGQGPLRTLATRLAGHTALYSVGTVLTMAFAVVNLAVLTRLLAQSSFGALVILMLYSGLITLLCNLGTVQGTMMSAYSGGAPGEGEDGDEEDGEVAEKRPSGDNRRRLTTGLVLTLCVGAVVTAVGALFSPELSSLLIGSREYATEVTWATAAGALGSVWRLVSGIPRMERRPRTFIALQLTRGVLVLGASVALISLGYGLTGAVAGQVLGKVVAVSLGLIVSRHRFRLAMSRPDAAAIIRNGRPLIVISVGFFLARNVDIFVLSRYASNADVAIYRVAERIGQMPAMGVSAALFAWGPLTRGPIRVALDRHHSVDFARSRIVTYYVFLAVAVFVGVAMWADVLIRVAPAEYRSATDLLILMAISAGLNGGLTISYRMTRSPRKIAAFRRVAVITFLVILAAALVLVPPYGAKGAAYASIIAPLPGLAIMLVRSQRGPEPLDVSGWRLLACGALGVAWIGLGWGLRSLVPELEIPIDVIITLGFPVLLVATGIFPRAEAMVLLGLLKAPWRIGLERRRLRSRLAELDNPDRELLDSLARRRQRPAEVAARYGESDDEVLARFVALLRRLDGIGTPTTLDSAIGRYVLSGESTPQRDRMGHMLSLREDAVPMELDRLVVVVQRLRAR